MEQNEETSMEEVLYQVGLKRTFYGKSKKRETVKTATLRQCKRLVEVRETGKKPGRM